MSDVVSNIGVVLTAMLSWFGDIFAWIVSTPILSFVFYVGIAVFIIAVVVSIVAHFVHN